MRKPTSSKGVLAIIQARLSSVRFPKKVLADLEGRPLIEFMIERVQASKQVEQIVLAVPEEDLDSPFAEIAARLGIELYGGASQDVLSRFADVVDSRSHETIVRLTGDCPLIDPSLIDTAILEFWRSKADYLRTGTTFPDGVDVEVTRRTLILAAAKEALAPDEREHVTPWIMRNRNLRQIHIDYQPDLGHLRLTVDEKEDLAVVRKVLKELAPSDRNLSGISELWTRDPKTFEVNSHLKRDQGSRLSDAQKLWKRAQAVIPGGVSLLSKRPDMNLPGRWPTYFLEARGCRVRSIDGQELIDMGMMGVGTSILGFGDARVDEAVSRVIRTGVVSTLNCPEEVLLAERLVDLHPWSSQARFARSGGEACAMAVRIARAASSKDTVAICGYHGWHDWYLAANLLSDHALDSHLLPGLSPRGVPSVLRGTALPFKYNDVEALRLIVDRGDVGAIVMEVERSVRPDAGFLEAVRELATASGIVLVFDESTSGFRKTLGGHHLTLGVIPDIAVFGKTLGNGYAITAVLGTSAVMDVVPEIFLSSTFWSERIGPAAALATLAAMEDDDAPGRINQIGVTYRNLIATKCKEMGTHVEFSGLPALTSVCAPDGFDGSLLKTFVTRELLGRGYLSGLALYAALPHENEIEKFADHMSTILNRAVNLGPEGVSRELVDQPLVGTGFTRLA